MTTPRLTRTQRNEQGVTLADLPAHIPNHIKTDALKLLKSRDYIVYIPGARHAPAWMRNRWLVVNLDSGREGPETLEQWANTYYSFRQTYDAWQDGW